MTMRSYSPARGRGLAYRKLALAMIASAVNFSVEAQVAPTKTAGQGRGTESSQSPDATPDIIVTGIPKGPYPVTVDANSADPQTVAASRQAASNAHFFSQCVKSKDRSSLKALMDGPPNRDVRASALQRIVDDNAACYPGHSRLMAMSEAHYFGECNPNPAGCQSFYDRGALIERVLKLYAPKISFTTKQLINPTVMTRLKVREHRFDKTRARGEIAYSQIAVCIVLLHPAMALNYPRTVPNSDNEMRLRNALIGLSSDCFKGAKRVSLVPAEFRIYLADAIYSWATAVRQVDSLVPND